MWFNYRPNFKTGDIIIFCGDQFVVIENHGCTGVVKENCKDGAIIKNFYWEYQGEQCKKISV